MRQFMAGVLLASGWFAFGVQKYHEHERSAEVAMWAEQAYEQGASDTDAKPKVRAENERFVVDTVVAAHRGAWDKF